ncbi:LLM class flavin-dependent oxidoreductase [Paenibacillus oenotherae]|uniref:LLM class flavin-dependent oxidoreductase n=1 Tax=Paenibacillus oenotherae TaxID=1435645 RepID=A0ABS7D0F8_9BACL|nr:LLM class flavin-dependent oxidoreductase [Paenibacillus oenotherae]MBW7473369.1 LLM class flavin-dependent oxidoreductase [Paenibacillus oenotherae]
MKRDGMMHLNLFVMGNGHHEAAWRLHESAPDHVTGIDYYKRLAHIAERGKLDSLFLADAYGLPPTIQYKVLMSLEPFTLLSALAMCTERIGLIGTASTTYNEPFHVARKFASLDFISGGRAGWNIVTSTSDVTAANFADERLPAHSERYERAGEFLEVVQRLWDSWEDDALLADQTEGVYADTERIHQLNYKGRFFAVRGPLNLPRPPQGHPLLVQAGASDSGKAFAAGSAEVVYTAQNTMEDGRRFYADLHARAAACGRSSWEMKVLPGFCAVIGDTEAEAVEKENSLHELIQPEFGLSRLSNVFKTDMSVFDLDEPLPFDKLPKQEEINGHRGRHQLFMDMARREGLTVRQLMMRTASSRGHYAMAGTPVQIADEMERWFMNRAADGFNLMPPYLPGSLEEFVDKVVPELQNRGLFRTEYEGFTLRDHYGLKRPPCRNWRHSHEQAVRQQ